MTNYPVIFFSRLSGSGSSRIVKSGSYTHLRPIYLQGWYDESKEKNKKTAVEMIEKVVCSVERHLWYMSEELVIFALFDEGLDDTEREKMSRKLKVCIKQMTRI